VVIRGQASTGSNLRFVAFELARAPLLRNPEVVEGVCRIVNKAGSEVQRASVVLAPCHDLSRSVDGPGDQAPLGDGRDDQAPVPVVRARVGAAVEDGPVPAVLERAGREPGHAGQRPAAAVEGRWGHYHEMRLRKLRAALQTGVPVAQAARTVGVSYPTAYKWRRAWKLNALVIDAIPQDGRSEVVLPLLGEVAPSAPPVSVGKRAEKLIKLRAALEAGESTRSAARTAGVHHNTATKWRRIWKIDVNCACGLPSTHQGWCAVRLKQSPRRQEVLKKLHEPKAMRTSVAHWGELSTLFSSFERCVEACARLDAYRLAPKNGDPALVVVEARMRVMADRLDREMDRASVELLNAGHARVVAA
jgi:transposase-like protein